MSITVDDIIEATGGRLLSENSRVFNGVSIDSRTIAEGELFFAIRGDSFDGHAYLKDALIKGTGAVVEERPQSIPDDRVIITVNDTLRSLQDLAHFLRMKRDIPVLAVTGSNGKTTTKEMLHEILSSRFRTLKNEGNLNNHIGLPLSLAALSPEDEAIVLEMGMNAPGEIRRLCEIANPEYGVITNVGSAHVGRLGSYEAVRDAKLEILEGISTVIVNADDLNLMKGVTEVKGFGGKIITFGIDRKWDVRATDLRSTAEGTEFVLCSGDDKTVVDLKTHGIFNVYNALAAAAAAQALGMGLDEIADSLERYRPFAMRFEIIKKGGVTVINDAYNANPSSMEESVKELVRLASGGRAVAVLGDMSELRDFSEGAHREIGRMVSAAGVALFVGVGEKMKYAEEEISNMKDISHAPEVRIFRDASEASAGVPELLKEGDTILFKGSRKMGLERVIRSMTDVI